MSWALSLSLAPRWHIISAKNHLWSERARSASGNQSQSGHSSVLHWIQWLTNPPVWEPVFRP